VVIAEPVMGVMVIGSVGDVGAQRAASRALTATSDKGASVATLQSAQIWSGSGG
jgi:hypothetical protein